MGNGLGMLQIWNEKAQTQLVKLSEYHSHVIIVSNFYERVNQLEREHGKSLNTDIMGVLRDHFVTWLL